MKKLTLWLCMSLFLACGGFAQDKKLVKQLCRTWVPDKKAMSEAMAGKPEFERMLRDLETDKVFLSFSKDQTLYTGDPNSVRRTEWKMSPDGKKVSFGGAELEIQELSDKKFTFVMERKKELVFYFIPASKDLGAKLTKRMKESSQARKEEPKSEEAKPAEPRREEPVEKKERE